MITRKTKVSAGVLIDNFLDVSHFSYLHPATFGRLAPVTDENCVVERRDSGGGAPNRTTVRVLLSWPASDPEGLAKQIELSIAVLEEDLSILELMADPRLELSLHAELHTRADRASVEYRRMMADHLRCVAQRSVTA